MGSRPGDYRSSLNRRARFHLPGSKIPTEAHRFVSCLYGLKPRTLQGKKDVPQGLKSLRENSKITQYSY
jgi:hypothetical protein